MALGGNYPRGRYKVRPKTPPSEDERQLRRWRAWRRERIDTVLNGPHEPLARDLLNFLSKMTLQDGSALITHVRACDWSQVDRDTRLELLSWINRTITRLREQAGLPPIDDPLPHERSTAFIIIRELFG